MTAAKGSDGPQPLHPEGGALTVRDGPASALVSSELGNALTQRSPDTRPDGVASDDDEDGAAMLTERSPFVAVASARRDGGARSITSAVAAERQGAAVSPRSGAATAPIVSADAPSTEPSLSVETGEASLSLEELSPEEQAELAGPETDVSPSTSVALAKTELPFDSRKTHGYDEEPPVLLPGTVLGGSVTIKQLIARGGICEVYEADSDVLQGDFAVKVLNRRFATRTDVIDRLEFEARVLQKFRSHQGIVQIFIAGRDPVHGTFIVMERLRGKTLRDILNATGRIPVAQAVGLTVLIADIMHDLHGLGIIHRDLKLENTFLESQGRQQLRVVVLDLGCAKDETRKTTAANRTMGTVRYMAPEHLQGEKVDARADQYALGHMLYELLLGEHAIDVCARKHGTNDPFLEASWQVFALFEPLPDWCCPAGLWQIIARMLQKSPADRYDTMKELADALREFLQAYMKGKSEDVLAELACTPSPQVKGGAIPNAPVPKVIAPIAPTAPEQRISRAELERTAIDDVGGGRTEPSEYVGGPEHVGGKTPEIAKTIADTSGKRGVTRNPKIPLDARLATASIAELKDGKPVSRWVLDHGAVLGRDRAAADIRLDDDSVSRLHAELKPVQDSATGAYAIADLGSRNGIEVDGVIGRYGKVEPFGLITIGNVILQLLPAGHYDANREFVPVESRVVTRGVMKRRKKRDRKVTILTLILGLLLLVLAALVLTSIVMQTGGR